MTTPFNRVRFTPASGGTGDFVVSAAVTGYSTPAQRGIANNTQVSYTAESEDKTEWETGLGTYTTGDTTLARSSVRENSLGDTTKIDFTDPPTVWLDWHAQEFDNYRHSSDIIMEARRGVASGAEDGGLLTLTAGHAAGSFGDGGSLELSSGFGAGVGDGGNILHSAGSAGDEGAGGSVTIQTGTGGTTDGNGGDLIFQLGASPGTGRDGLFFPDLPTGDPGVSGAAYIDGSGFVKISP